MGELVFHEPAIRFFLSPVLFFLMVLLRLVVRRRRHEKIFKDLLAGHDEVHGGPKSKQIGLGVQVVPISGHEVHIVLSGQAVQDDFAGAASFENPLDVCDFDVKSLVEQNISWPKVPMVHRSTVKMHDALRNLGAISEAPCHGEVAVPKNVVVQRAVDGVPK